MANLGVLLSVTEPSGFWVNIIKAFEGVTKNYVLAIIFLTVVIRLIWGIVETFSKFGQQKQQSVQAKMQPELEKLKVKYQSQPEVLNQKQNELYKKYYGKGYYGSCIIMLIIMVLNLLIFLTLFTGLNSMASFKIANNYDNLKYQYVNSLNVADHYLGDYEDSEKRELFADYKNLEFKVSQDGEYIGLFHKDNGQLVEGSLIKFEKDFSSTKKVLNQESGDEEDVTVLSNTNIINLIQKIFPEDKQNDFVIGSQTIKNENGEDEVVDLYLSSAIQNIAMESVITHYDLNKDSFLWIENIWIADSPFDKSIVSYKTLVSQVGKKNIEEGEETIYNSFMPELAKARSKANGYLILPILCVLASVFSMYINSLYNKLKNKKKGIVQAKGGFKWAQLILPIILGIFALFYNSVFAIYMLTGQLVASLLSPLQLFVIDKIMDRKKGKQENVTVDYSRKF